MEISGLQLHRIPVRWESVWDSWTVAGGTAVSAKPPVLLSSIVFGLLELFLPRRVQQTLTDSELLSVVRTAVGHCIGSF